MDRRGFLETVSGAFLLGASGAYAFRVLKASSTAGTHVKEVPSGRKWGMLIDLTKCRQDCKACLEACREENNVAFVGDNRYDVHLIRIARLLPREGGGEGGKSVILLCNQCDKPPCAQVCPVRATYKRDDGIVIVDPHRCIGCRYCMIACPYNARYFNMKDSQDWPNKAFPKRSHGVAQACDLCAHRLDVGKPPACVEACSNKGGGALLVGDLNNPDAEISRLIAKGPVKRIRADLGTEPKVYYVGL